MSLVPLVRFTLRDMLSWLITHISFLIGFGYEFNSLKEEEGSELAQAYKALLEPPKGVSGCHSRASRLLFDILTSGRIWLREGCFNHDLGCTTAES